MTVQVVDRDRGLKGWRDRLRTLGRREVAVGILGPKADAAEDDGPKTVLFVATIHEFGAPRAKIPARSFVRAYVDENSSKIKALQSKLFVDVLAGKLTPDAALDRIGAVVAAGMQARISRGIDPPLSPKTIARKGSSKPLINTGQLRSSITWLVRKRS